MTDVWGLLFDTLLSEREELSRQVRQATQDQIHSYRALDLVTLDAEVGLEVARVPESAVERSAMRL